MRFQPGDMIGFADCSMMSFGIRVCSGGRCGSGLSHVGIVVEHPDYRSPLIFEATTRCSLPCLYANERVSGVQAHRLAERIAQFSGSVWHYPLTIPLGLRQMANLRRYCVDSLGLPYDWWGAWLARRTFIRCLTRRFVRDRTLGKLFCSEFVVRAWAAVAFTGLPADLAPTQLATLAVKRGFLQPPEQVILKQLGA